MKLFFTHISPLLLSLFIFCALPAPIFAKTVGEQQTPITTATRLQHRYDAMKSLTFDFFQHTQGSMTGRPQTGEGHAKFLKQDDRSFMRWDYTLPAKQILTSDGITFSMYFEEMNQLIVTPAKNLESDITYSFFTGKGKLEEDFEISEPDATSVALFSDLDDIKVIKLTPKKDQSQVQDIHIWVTEDSLIGRIQIRDHFDTVTVLSFTNLVVDTLTAGDLESFQFIAPEDAEVIKQ